MSHRIHQQAHPIRALGEPKAEGSGTARVVAKSNHGGLLNTNRCWDFVRRKSVGRPMRTFGISKHSCREVRRQRAGRAGQSSSSEKKNSRGGLAGFPTGKASRQHVSRKAGEAEQASHRASSSKSRRRRSWRAQRTCACTTKQRAQLVARPANFQKGRSVPDRLFFLFVPTPRSVPGRHVRIRRERTRIAASGLYPRSWSTRRSPMTGKHIYS